MRTLRAVSVALVILASACAPSGPDTTEAMVVCQKFAARRYSMPATVKHAGWADSKISTHGETVTVSAWSDLPNRRVSWTCSTRPTGGSNWELISLT